MVSGCAAITANNAFYGAWIDHETGTFYGGPYAVDGLIGRPWQPFSLPKLPENTCTVKGFPVCRVGGIFAWDDCVRYLMAGSHITGLCSAVYFRGVGVLKDCINGMSAFMDHKGYKSIEAFRGGCADQFGYVRGRPKEDKMAEKTPILPHFANQNRTKCGLCEKVCPYGAMKAVLSGMTPKIWNRERIVGSQSRYFLGTWVYRVAAASMILLMSSPAASSTWSTAWPRSAKMCLRTKSSPCSS